MRALVSFLPRQRYPLLKRDIAGFVVLTVCATGCAQRMDDLDEKMAELEKRTASLEVKTGAPVGSDRELLQGQKLADVRTQVGSLRNDLTVLAGKIESLEFENKRLTTKTEALSEDIRQIQQQVKGLNTSPSSGAADNSPQADYDRGLKMHQDGDFKGAEKAFENFLSKNARHPLADNALYWLGEGAMNQKLYKQAVAYFQDLIDRFPKSDKKCEAMAKQITALKELGMEKESKAFAKARAADCK